MLVTLVTPSGDIIDCPGGLSFVYQINYPVSSLKNHSPIAAVEKSRAFRESAVNCVLADLTMSGPLVFN